MIEEKPLVSICIPLYERDEWFDKLIKSIEDHDAGIPYEICIGEGKNSASFNRNLAQRKAKSNFICQLDGDAEIIHDGWLKLLYDTLIENDKIGIVGGIIEKNDGVVDHCGTILIKNTEVANKRLDRCFKGSNELILKMIKKRVNGHVHFNLDYNMIKDKIANKKYSVEQCPGVCFMYDRRKLGEFLQEIYIKAGWEDVDFMARCKLSGYYILINSKVRIRHPNHDRTDEEHDLRDNKQSERGFNANNFVSYLMMYGRI